MKVFVTGASGYAGFYAAIALRSAGHTVYGLLRNTDTKIATDLQKNEIHLVTGSLGEPDTYHSELQQSDVIIHTAIDYRDPVKIDRIFLEALSKIAATGYRKPLLVYTTGCSVYGKVDRLIMDETTLGNPNSPLAFRMEQEKFVLSMESIKKVIVRPGFMYGKDARSSMSGAWFKIGIDANRYGKATYHGDPQKRWSWVHIEDLAQAYVKIAESSAYIDGEIFCLADEQRIKVLDVMTACVRAAGFDGDIELAPTNQADWFNVASDQNELITSRKAYRMLNWSPRHTGVLDNLETYYQAWIASQP